VEGLGKKQLLFSPDGSSPGDRAARLVFYSNKNSAYRVVVTSSRAGETGAYVLKIREVVPAGPAITMDGKLTCRDTTPQGLPVAGHTGKLEAEVAYTIEVDSADFVPRSILAESSNAKAPLVFGIPVLLEGKQRSRIDFTPPRTSVYRLLVGAPPGETGAYTVRIQAYKLAETEKGPR
jgi:hypothetical protein